MLLYDGMDLHSAIHNVEQEVHKIAMYYDNVHEASQWNVTLKFLRELEQLREENKELKRLVRVEQ